MPPKVVSQVARISCLGWAMEEVMANRMTISMRENLCIYVKFVGKDNKLLMILLLLSSELSCHSERSEESEYTNVDVHRSFALLP